MHKCVQACTCADMHAHNARAQSDFVCNARNVRVSANVRMCVLVCVCACAPARARAHACARARVYVRKRARVHVCSLKF